MSFCPSILCSDCGKIFNDSTRRPCIGKCNHSICLTCKNSLNSSNCSICDAADAFGETIYNHETVNVLGEFLKSLTEKEIDAFTKGQQNLGHGPCSKCNYKSEKLRVCTVCNPLVQPRIKGTWDVISEKNVGESMFLKVKSLAVCANCAIEHHDGHKIILLNSLTSLKNHSEKKTISALGALIESNWQRECSDTGYSKLVFIFKSILLRWKIWEFLRELETDQMEFSAQITTENPIWAAQLADSVAEIREHRKKVDDITKLQIMLQKDELVKEIVLLAFFGELTKENRRYTLQLIEVYESFPNDLLSRTQPEYHQTNVIAQIQSDLLTMEMCKRVPRDRQADVYYLRCEMIKEELRECFKEIKIRKPEYDNAESNCGDSFVKNTNFNDNWENDLNKSTIEPTENPNEFTFRMKDFGKFLNSNQEMMNRRLAADQATVNWLQALYNERFVMLMYTKCFPIVAHRWDVFQYIMEIEGVLREINDVVEDLKH